MTSILTMEHASDLEASNPGKTSETMLVNAKIAELTHNQFHILFNELFTEAMDENMEKMNCK